MDVTRTMLRRSGIGPKCLENFPARRINPDLATGGQTLRMPGWIRPRRFGRALSNGPDVGGGHSCDDGRGCRFINTAVPRFDGTFCWQQVKWMVTDDGSSSTVRTPRREALNVALLMPVKERERWKDLVDGLSELGILAVRGFADMGERARNLMIHNKFIAAQQSCELRRHLDGAAADASIRDIVDSCRVWESHTEAGYNGCDGLNPKFLRTISQVAADAQPQLASEGSETS